MKSVKGSFRRIRLLEEEVDVAIREYIENRHDPVVVFPKDCSDYSIVYDAEGVSVEIRYVDITTI